MTSVRTATAAAVLALGSPNALAQTPAAPPPLDAASRRAVVDSVTVQVERLYVDADTGRMIADVLRANRRAGWQALKNHDVAEARRRAVATLSNATTSLESWRLMYCALRGH